MNIQETKQQIKKYLHQQGYKLTPQRELIINILLQNEKAHLSAEEIFLLTKKDNKAIGLATVYRTLEVLTDMEIVDKVIFQDGLARYDLQSLSLKHSHHHLVCQKCGNVEEIDDDFLSELAPQIKNKYQFTLADHQLTFYGLCHNCNQDAK